MPRDKAVNQVLSYYTTLVGASIEVSKLREIVAAFWGQSAPINSTRATVEVLALLLHASQVKICFFCHAVRPYEDFRTIGSRACATCRAPANRGYQRRWQAQNREHRRR